MTNRLKHDKIFRKAMKNPLVAYEFFDTYLPATIKDVIDFSSLTIKQDSFIELDLTESVTDVLFSAKFNNQDGYLYLLTEHQSSPDHFMAFRLFKYMTRICDQYLTENPKVQTLPLIYPLLFFNGQHQYNVSRNLWDLFEQSQLVKDIWTNDYQLVNVHDIPDSELKKKALAGILAFFMKHIHQKNLLKKWQEVADILPNICEITIGHDYIKMLLHYTLTKINQSDKIELKKLLTTTLNQQTGEEIMGSLAHYWEQQGEARGEARGIQLGEARGETKLVKAMNKNGCSVEEISKMTKLSVNKIKELLKIPDNEM